MQLQLAVAAAALAGLLSGPTVARAEPCACCASFEPYAPATTRAIESGWGEPVHGVSILAATSTDSVMLGAPLEVEVFFRFDPFESNGRVRVLPRPWRERWTMILESERNGGAHRRPAYDVGFPMPPGAPLELRYGGFHSTSRTFHLLSSDGEQVPAGRYAVRLRYESEAPGPSSRSDPDGPDPGSEWHGVITTDSFPLEILPSDGDTTFCGMPARIRIERRDEQLVWQWDEASLEPVRIVSRPGYALGFKYHVHAFVLAAAADPIPTGTPSDVVEEILRLRAGTDMRGWGAPPEFSAGWRVLTRSPVAGLLNERRRLHLRVTAAVFESSAQSRHHWRPERADFRVLEEREITATWP